MGMGTNRFTMAAPYQPMGMSPAPMMPMYSMPMPVEGQPMMMQSAQPMMMPSAQPVPNPGETSPGWEYKDGKWIFVGQTAAPAPQPMPMFTGSAQPMMMPMQTMPMQSMPMYGGYPMMMAPGGGSAAPNPGPAQL